MLRSSVSPVGSIFPAGRHGKWWSCVISPMNDGRQQDARVKLSMTVSRETHRVILFQGAETHTRSVLKAVSWRTLGTLDTFVISWFLTGKLELAGLIAGFEFITKIGWYYLHERVWASIAWGRH
jgi:uncharacterized membrane protein